MLGWGTWIRTRTDGVRVRCSTVKLFPNNGPRSGTHVSNDARRCQQHGLDRIGHGPRVLAKTGPAVQPDDRPVSGFASHVAIQRLRFAHPGKTVTLSPKHRKQRRAVRWLSQARPARDGRIHGRVIAPPPSASPAAVEIQAGADRRDRIGGTGAWRGHDAAGRCRQ